METPSDEELEWREEVYRAERANDAQKQRLSRPFWLMIFEQIVLTSWQFALLSGLIILALLAFGIRSKIFQTFLP